MAETYDVCVVVNSVYIVHTNCELVTHAVAGVNSRHLTLPAGTTMPCVYSCEVTKQYTRTVNSGHTQ